MHETILLLGISHGFIESPKPDSAAERTYAYSAEEMSVSNPCARLHVLLCEMGIQYGSPLRAQISILRNTKVPPVHNIDIRHGTLHRAKSDFDYLESVVLPASTVRHRAEAFVNVSELQRFWQVEGLGYQDTVAGQVRSRCPAEAQSSRS